MFTRAFVTQIIEPAAAGDPSFIAQPVLWAAQVMLHHIVFFNAIFATTQLLIALGLLVPRTRKLALAVSVAYALSVWWLGEGLGGILTGTSPLAGLPGGVILYALVALLLWPPKVTVRPGVHVPASTGLFGPTGAGLMWAALWGSFAYYFLLPANRGAKALAQLFSASAAGEPGWLRSAETALANLVGDHGALVSVFLAMASVFTALGIFKPSLVKPALLLASGLALVIWVTEAFGGIFTGTGTDPNTGPLLVVLVACYWPYRAAVRRRPGRAMELASRSRHDGNDVGTGRRSTELDLRSGPSKDRELVGAGQAQYGAS
jgi:hypothetical protein